MKKDIPQIHVIRVLATLGIFLHHFWNGQYAAKQAFAGGLLDATMQSLALGVVIFNVMTAFLMTLPFAGPSPAPPPVPWSFLKKRLARICPQYYICLLAFTAISALVFRQTDLAGLLASLASRLVFLQTFQYQAFMSNIAAYWWLGLLVQFTLVFPWLVRLLQHLKVGPFRLCLFSWAVFWPMIEIVKACGRAYPDTAGTFSFLFTFNLPARLPEFAMGMAMAAFWKASPEKAWPLDAKTTALLACALAVSLACAAVPGLPAPHLTGAAWCFAIFAALFALPLPQKLAGSKTLLALSAVSYSVYLTHQPILSYCGELFAALASWPRFWTVAATALAASLVAARCVDRLAGAAVTAMEREKPSGGQRGVAPLETPPGGMMPPGPPRQGTRPRP
ncbi:MAG: acyltransferase [Desulfovibrionaceae bacterium]|nr:acyltransferase [Desulfovibrionaceae bacterium]MBF0515074.1 acyltransferase [Desulfovibrionaceae bacterium]